LREGRERFGIRRWRLSVDASNRRAVRLYEKCGFVPAATFRGRYNGVEADFILMRMEETS
jgi:RimJ/RimL family protein N-acetyltransferase